MTPRTAWSQPFLIAAAAVMVTLLAALWQAPPLLKALFTPVASTPPEASIESYQARHEDESQRIRERIIGRSLFFPPPPPPPLQPDRAKREPEADPGPPPPPPPPAEYAGPLTLSFIYGDDVWFSKGGREMIRLRPGDEHSGVKLVSIAAPWSVNVLWKEREFTLPQFKSWPKGSDPFLLHAPRATRPLPGLIDAGSKADTGPPAPPGSMSSAAGSR